MQIALRNAVPKLLFTSFSYATDSNSWNNNVYI